MNILVLHSQVPFVQGGAEVLVDGLLKALEERGHAADKVSLPLNWNPVGGLLESALNWRLLTLKEFNGRAVDHVICTKFPTWAVSHPRKSLWLIHQHRQAYDLYGSPMSEFKPGIDGNSVRQRVIAIDRREIALCEPRFAISKNVSDRLQTYCGLSAKPLYPPVPFEGLKPESFEPYILYVGRLDRLKRVQPILDAWPLVDTSLRLVVVGDGPDRRKLEELAARSRHGNQITFTGRVSDAELVRHYNRCRAVFYAPVDEDYGYAAVEALAAGKPVITAPDSGGILEFVEHDRTGFVSELAPESLARAINAFAVEATAKELGRRGPTRTASLTWDHVVNSLIGF